MAPQFDIPITPSLYVQDEMPWANAVAHSIRDELDDLKHVMELWNPDAPTSKIPDMLKVFGADELMTNLFDDDFLRAVYQRLPLIVRYRLTAPSHRLFADALGVSYSKHLEYPTLRIYLTPQRGQAFTDPQIEYINRVYRWLTPVGIVVDLTVAASFDYMIRVGLPVRTRAVVRL